MSNNANDWWNAEYRKPAAIKMLTCVCGVVASSQYGWRNVTKAALLFYSKHLNRTITIVLKHIVFGHILTYYNIDR